MSEKGTLGEVASLVRAKNAGPFWITLDAFFESTSDYDDVVGADIITAATIGELYRVDPATVRVFHVPAARAIKVSFPRPAPQGSFRDRDMHAGQQHIPLAALRIA
jgi:hypothetical protein